MTGRKGRVAALARRDGLLCHYCLELMHLENQDPHKMVSVEHIVPRSLGGSGTQYNMVLAHHYCNEKRGNRNAEHPGCSTCRYARYMHAISPDRDLLSLGCTL